LLLWRWWSEDCSENWFRELEKLGGCCEMARYKPRQTDDIIFFVEDREDIQTLKELKGSNLSRLLKDKRELCNFVENGF